ncbi:MAG: DNA-processing protein DprA [Myxococcaceae bacterium]
MKTARADSPPPQPNPQAPTRARRERQRQWAAAALWSLQGVGPITLAQAREVLGDLAAVLDEPISTWVDRVKWHGDEGRRQLARYRTLRGRAEWLFETCRARAMHVLFPRSPGWPDRLPPSVAPPVLFARGAVDRVPAARSVAIVGSRRTHPDRLAQCRAIAAEAASVGLRIVSGAAIGIDTAAHSGALSVKGHTIAFMGSALDELDEAPRQVAAAIVGGGGVAYSQFPPGFRPSRSSFRLRNKLIAGSADATLVCAAQKDSGALYTANDAKDLGRPVLVTLADPGDAGSIGGLELLRDFARPHLSLYDLLHAVGLSGAMASGATQASAVDLATLSAPARRVLEALALGSADFEALGGVLDLGSGQLSAALLELEVVGAVVQKGGRRYEKR